MKALVDSEDVKTISHPVLVLLSDTLWVGVVRRQFTVSKIGFLFSLILFMLCQAILPKVQGAEQFNMQMAIFCGRLINYAFSLTRLTVFHLRRTRRAYQRGDFHQIGCLKIPGYLFEWDAQMGALLLLCLAMMCINEPMLYCSDKIGTTGPTEECESAEAIRPIYVLFSMGAMVLHWLLLIDLSVFTTKLAAFVLVCKHVLSEVGKFLVAMVFILVMFSSAIATLRHDADEFSTVAKCANCLFAVTVGLYEGDYREMMHEPFLLVPVLLFVTVSAILLINLLIAQLNCSYDFVYADMLGFARLSRADLIVDSMGTCPLNRWKRFVASLRFDQLLEFDEGDVGLSGGIQIREPANQNVQTVDIIQRFGGTSSPEMQWPEEGIEEDPVDRIKALLAQINKKASETKRTKKRGGGSGGGSGASGGGPKGGSNGSAGSEPGSEEHSSHSE